MKIEDYALIGDTHTAALVGRDGSVDWFPVPRFDSAACFAALVGTKENGHWSLSPAGGTTGVVRRYRRDSLVLETDFRTADGALRITDAMPIRERFPAIVRVVRGLEGAVRVRCDLRIRFDYGRTRPWVRKIDGGVCAIAGPDALVLRAPVALGDENGSLASEFVVREGESVPFALTSYPSHEKAPDSPDAMRAIEETDSWWRVWASRCTYRGAYRDDVVRSLITLKALTYGPTGGIVAAATTSLPESIGYERNWDYRYCWLRDATLSLYTFIHTGYREEACAWRDWLLRAAAGDPEDLRIVYGPAGERHLGERTIEQLPGYESSKPVRVGNAAENQLQLDVYGEILDAMHQARRTAVPPEADAWTLQRALTHCLERRWAQPDAGIWELRGQRAHHTHSKAMAWVAFDRAVKAVEQHGMTGPANRWRRLRDAIHQEVCAKGFNAALGSFTQAYESDVMDASVLLLPSIGFLPPSDPRIRGTIEAVERVLLSDGFVLRYVTTPGRNLDGLRGRDGAFLACSCWLADAYALGGRREDAERLFQRILAVKNDVGLLSEEYDTRRRRLVGNFPQTFSHVAVVNSAMTLAGGPGGAQERMRT